MYLQHIKNLLLSKVVDTFNEKVGNFHDRLNLIITRINGEASIIKLYCR